MDYNNNFILIERIFKEELLEYDVYRSWHSVDEINIVWRDSKIQKKVESNKSLNDYLIGVLKDVCECAVQGGDLYGLKTTFKNNNLGFLIWSGVSHELIYDCEPEGLFDSKVFYSDEFLNSLKLFDALKEISIENINDFLEFKISEGSVHYFKIYCSIQEKWFDYEEIEHGNEIVDLFYSLYDDSIYFKEEFNIVNDHIYFTNSTISFFKEEQTIIQDNEFVPIDSIVRLDDFVNNVNSF